MRATVHPVKSFAMTGSDTTTGNSDAIGRITIGLVKKTHNANAIEGVFPAGFVIFRVVCQTRCIQPDIG